MSEWAIEAVNLVKQFPGRGAPPADKESALSTDKTKPSHHWWQLSRRPASVMATAVDHLCLQIRRGEVFGLLGPNGAGKSTTIRMLCTLLEPTSGSATVNGYDLIKQPNLVRQSLGTVLAGERSIYWKLTARENLQYFAALYHIPPDIARRRIDMLLERMELTARANDLVEKYSTGMKQRVAIARALLARPPILLLDEPTLGLDPQAARRVRELVTELRSEGHTILLTTHYMEEADQLSDRIGIIDKGGIIALDTPTNLKQRLGQQEVIHLEISGWHSELGEGMRAIPGVENLLARRLEMEPLWEVSLHAASSRAVLPGVIQGLSHNGARLVNLRIDRPSLEDVFIHLTGKALRD